MKNNTWQENNIQNLCEIVNGKTPLRSNDEYWLNGDVPWFTLKDQRKQGKIIYKTNQFITQKALEKSGMKLVPRDSVLICCTASVGEYAFTKIPLTTNQQFNSLIVKNTDEITPEYLFHYSSQIVNKLLNLMGRTTFGFVSVGQLGSIKIEYPNLKTQQKIALILSTVDEEIQKTDQMIEKTEKLKNGLMNQLLDNKSKKWREFTLDELCNFTTGRLNSNMAVKGGKYPFFTCAQETFTIDSFSFDTKAVLLAGNNAAGIYSVKYYDGKFDAYQRTYVITVKDDVGLDYFFLKELLNIRLNMLKDYSVGSSTKFLTLKLLLGIKVPLPPIETQIKISEVLRNIDIKLNLEKHQKDRLINLKMSLMGDIFNQKIKIN